MLKARAGIDVLHVPYKGSAPAKAAVMANEVSMTFEPAFTGLPQITAGKLRALAVMNAKRSAVMPDVPTTAELGFGGIEMSAWVGLVAPAATPPAVVEAGWPGEIERIVAEPAVQQTLLRSGAESRWATTAKPSVPISARKPPATAK
ncbi:tripartite tricarboxylate transporter substrate-binding protein [Cupriavidus basilensis]